MDFSWITAATSSGFKVSYCNKAFAINNLIYNNIEEYFLHAGWISYTAFPDVNNMDNSYFMQNLLPENME